MKVNTTSPVSLDQNMEVLMQTTIDTLRSMIAIADNASDSAAFPYDAQRYHEISMQLRAAAGDIFQASLRLE